MRKNKGDVTYYLEENSGIYHFIKKIKCYSKDITEGKGKTTKKTLSEFSFNNDNFKSIDFSLNGLRAVDKEIIIAMIKEINEGENDG
ncbi:hypothetical protein [Photorhabdus africana]|uniref:hypothetical protein n=1 Tax=Photorhabdus africana TaxID=3097554 RepID=UPI002B40273E|nr:hypothetical protein [Photorhabdus sp. CRI-LC]